MSLIFFPFDLLWWFCFPCVRSVSFGSFSGAFSSVFVVLGFDSLELSRAMPYAPAFNSALGCF